MKKNIIIIVLIVTASVSLLFAYNQKIEAEKWQHIAQAQTEIAEQMRENAEVQKRIAEEAVVNALEQVERARAMAENSKESQ